MKSITVTIETPRGSTAKYAVDPTTGRITLVREFSSSIAVPVDYGYMEDTRGENGAPLSAFVLLRSSVFPGVSIESRIVGSLLTEDRFRVAEGTVRSEIRVIAVPANDSRWKQIQNIDDVPAEQRSLMEFFVLHNRDLSPSEHQPSVSWGNADYTRTMVDIARLRFDTQFSRQR